MICYDRIVGNINADLYITIDNEKVGTLMGEALMQACPDGEIFLRLMVLLQIKMWMKLCEGLTKLWREAI